MFSYNVSVIVIRNLKHFIAILTLHIHNIYIEDISFYSYKLITKFNFITFGYDLAVFICKTN